MSAILQRPLLKMALINLILVIFLFFNTFTQLRHLEYFFILISKKYFATFKIHKSIQIIFSFISLQILAKNILLICNASIQSIILFFGEITSVRSQQL